MTTEKNETKKETQDEAKKAGIYTEDKQVILNHLKQSASRLMKAKYNGSAGHAMTLLNIATELETVESEPKPEPKPRAKK